MGGGGGGALNHLPLLFCKSVYYQTLFFQIAPYILTHLLVFGSPEGSPNTSKIRQNIRRDLAEKCLIIYNYYTYLYKRTVQIPRRDEQEVSGGICAPLTGSENWFDEFFLINFFWR